MIENKSNNKFKHGDWVIGKDTCFKVTDIRVFGYGFGYSGDSIDGYFGEENLEKCDPELVDSLEMISQSVKE